MAQQGLLWKVSKPGSKKVSYLFGTMHTSDSLCNTWSDAWWKAFDDCDMLAGEADFGDYSQAIQALTLSMMKDTVLSDLYSPEEYAFVDSILVEHGQEGMKYLHRKMRPLVSMLTYLETPESTGPFTELMDLRLQHMAVERGWQVAGLETAVEQLECLQVLSLEEEADMLLDVLSTADSSQNFLDDLTGTYLTQDLQKLAQDESMADYPPRLMHAILDVRNQRFLERLIPLMKKQRVFC
ncbi:MAG: TraB/GumN family protein, partial [Flavobacteriales bacterium]|nr:TraB/GumN family protein [Flavobacteriales bacterium]